MYPTLVGKPVAVAQRTLLVTTNYIARARGVPKMCTIEEGRRIVPDLVVIESDMARYRLAHRQLFDLLREMGLAPERASIDEAYLDLTPLLDALGDEAGDWRGPEVVVVGGDGATLNADVAEDAVLARGIVVATMIRGAIRDKMRFETSAGVSLNKSFAKHASGLHKPSRTCVVPLASHELLLQLPPEKLNGIGPAVMESLRDICASRLDCFVPQTLQQLQRLQRHELEVLGASGAWIYQLCRGIDTREVRDKGPPGSFGFQAAHRERVDSLQQLYGVILSKSEQMAARLEEDEELYQRSCRTLSVSFRFEGKTVTRACAMPASGANRALEICAAAMHVIAKHAKKDASVTQSQRFGLTATNFSGEGGMAERSISAFLVAGAEVDWAKGEEESRPAAAGGVESEGPMMKFAVKNAKIDWNSESEPPPMQKPKEQSGSIARFVVARPLIDWTNEPPKLPPRGERSGSIGKFLVKKEALKRVEREEEKEEGDDEVKAEGDIVGDNECPVCRKAVSAALLNSHVNNHFLDEEKKIEVKKKKPSKAGALDKFLARK